ncbi:MAG: ribonuclease HI [Deltaproteobacteria bacterium]|nr:ribonuclease HI [Deltaproteobacteria bacterium]
MLWVKRVLRGDTVYASANPDGSLLVDDGRVSIKYRLGATQKLYRAAPANLAPHADTAVIEEAGDEAAAHAAAAAPGAAKAKASAGKAAKSVASSHHVTPVTPGTIIIYTDGACIGNPGPMGLGVVLIDVDRRLELSEFLGHGTNNIAELTAIQRGLEAVAPEHRGAHILLHTDSAYSIGIITKPWKPKANLQLVAELRALCRRFPHLAFVKVPGHSGIPENERCDALAGLAIETRTSTRVESVLPTPA